MALKNIPALPGKSSVDVYQDKFLLSDHAEALDKDKGKLASAYDIWKQIRENYSFAEISLNDFSDPDDAEAQIQTELNDQNGQKVILGEGAWPIANGLEVPSYTTLEGTSNGIDGSNGTVLQLTDPTKTAILRPKQTVVSGHATLESRNVKIKKLVLDMQGSTVASGWRTDAADFIASGGGVLATSGIQFEDVTCTGSGSGAPAQIWFKDTTNHNFYNTGLSGKRVTFRIPTNGKGFQTDSSDNTTVLEQVYFLFNGIGAIGLYSEGIGNLQINGGLAEYGPGTPDPTTAAVRTLAGHANLTSGSPILTFSGSYDGTRATRKLDRNDIGSYVTGTNIPAGTFIKSIGPSGFSAVLSHNASGNVTDGSVTINRNFRSTSMPFCALYFKGNRNSIQINTFIDESCMNFMIVDGGLYAPIALTDCDPQSPIRIINGALCNLKINGGTHLSQEINVDETSQCVLSVDGTAVRTVTPYNSAGSETHALTTPKIEDQVLSGGKWTFGAHVTDGETIVVNGVTFTFKDSPSGAVQIQRGSTKEDDAANFAAKLNASSNAAIIVASYTVSGNIVTGAGGTDFTMANSSGGHVTRSGATFTGGVLVRAHYNLAAGTFGGLQPPVLYDGELRAVRGNGFAADDTKRALRIGMVARSSEDTINPYMWEGVLDDITEEPLNGYDKWLDSATGHKHQRGDQTGYSGYAFHGPIYSPVAATINPATATQTLDCNWVDNFDLTPTQDMTLGFQNLPPNSLITVRILTSGSTSYKISFTGSGAATKFGPVTTGNTTARLIQLYFVTDAAGSVATELTRDNGFNTPIHRINVGTTSGSPVAGFASESGFLTSAANYADAGGASWTARAGSLFVPKHTIFDTIQYGSSFEFSLTGLVPLRQYTLFVFSGWNGAEFMTQVKMNGDIMGSLTVGDASHGNHGVAAYEVIQGIYTHAADSDGIIAARFDSLGANGALVNALVLAG